MAQLKVIYELLDEENAPQTGSMIFDTDEYSNNIGMVVEIEYDLALNKVAGIGGRPTDRQSPSQ